MSYNKFLTIASDGVRKLLTAIGNSAGVSDANKIIATNSSGVLDPSFLPPGVGLNVETIVAGEALTAGNFVNIYNNSGTRTCRKADASNGREANGFVLANVSNAANATVYTMGLNNQMTSLTPGLKYKLSSASPGGVVAESTNFTTGQIDQIVGVALSTTSLLFEYDSAVTIG